MRVSAVVAFHRFFIRHDRFGELLGLHELFMPLKRLGKIVRHPLSLDDPSYTHTHTPPEAILLLFSARPPEAKIA